jgi:hypothetical protein
MVIGIAQTGNEEVTASHLMTEEGAVQVERNKGLLQRSILREAYVPESNHRGPLRRIIVTAERTTKGSIGDK